MEGREERGEALVGRKRGKGQELGRYREGKRGKKREIRGGMARKNGKERKKGRMKERKER